MQGLPSDLRRAGGKGPESSTSPKKPQCPRWAGALPRFSSHEKAFAQHFCCASFAAGSYKSRLSGGERGSLASSHPFLFFFLLLLSQENILASRKNLAASRPNPLPQAGAEPSASCFTPEPCRHRLSRWSVASARNAEHSPRGPSKRRPTFPLPQLPSPQNPAGPVTPSAPALNKGLLFRASTETPTPPHPQPRQPQRDAVAREGHIFWDPSWAFGPKEP